MAPILQAQGLHTASPSGPAANQVPPDLTNVGIDQKLNSQVPLNLPFRDETGQPVTLQKYFNNRPVILSLVYYDCPMLCTQVLNGLTHTMQLLKFNIGKDYQVVTVSFDPRETAQLAAQKKSVYVQRLGKPGAQQGWHFLTGDQDSIQKLTQAVGFRYKWDPQTQQFNHATAIMVLTPEGKVSKYLYGVEYAPTDMRFALIQASNDKIGTPVDAVLLFCCKYNATTGKYDLIVSRLLAIAGAATILILGVFLFVMFRFGPKKRVAPNTEAAASRSGNAT